MMHNHTFLSNEYDDREAELHTVDFFFSGHGGEGSRRERHALIPRTMWRWRWTVKRRRPVALCPVCCLHSGALTASWRRAATKCCNRSSSSAGDQ